MRIKRHPSGNEYIYAGGAWVRNFTKKNHSPLHLTHLFSHDDYATVVKNEQMNLNHPKVSNEVLRFSKVVVVSDGYKFEERHRIIQKLPKDVCVLAINRAHKKWKLLAPTVPAADRRSINGFVINNPYDEAATCLPSSDSGYFPTCIASVRTNYKFIKRYQGDVYTYCPTPEEEFGHETTETYYVDDYRNPVCAAISLAYQFRVNKLLLLCCDDSFEERRDFAQQLENGLYTYPQHVRSHELIDANLFWLTHDESRKVEVADYSSGPLYDNAAYINSEEEAIAFFEDNQEGHPS